MQTITTTWTDGSGPHTVTTERRVNESEGDWKLRHLSELAEEMGG